ncbi:cupin domain-containing protein [Rhizobiaceae bacterium]|nr:cupin domain-containing protein [Rhizobiaceae bacterium]
MKIIRSGTQPAKAGPAEYFTGAVRRDMPFDPPEPARVSGALVTFEPGARTAWHTHPLGQTLIVTVGKGWAQRKGGERFDIHPGDIVWFEPGEKHWHGGTSDTSVSHFAIAEKLDGSMITWLEHVSDADYLAG